MAGPLFVASRRRFEDLHDTAVFPEGPLVGEASPGIQECFPCRIGPSQLTLCQFGQAQFGQVMASCGIRANARPLPVCPDERRSHLGVVKSAERVLQLNQLFHQSSTRFTGNLAQELEQVA